MLKFKRILAAVIVSVMTVSAMSFTASASEYETPANLPVWDGSVADSYAGGNGTEDDPYLISDGSELALLAHEINSTESEASQNTAGKYYKLTADIVLNDVSNFGAWDKTAPANEWTPGGAVINYTIRAFAGHLDGNNYDVIGMYIDSNTGYNGLFGYVMDGQIKDLGIKHAYINGRQSTAGIAGYIRSSSTPVYISGCSVDSSSIIKGTSNVGGIGGYVEAYTKQLFIDKCSNGAKINSQYNYAGGIAGCLVAYMGDSTDTYTVQVTNCINTGSVDGKTGVGGIMGSSKDFVTNASNTNTVSLLIKNCVNAGYIPTTDEHTGVIAGTVGPADREDKNVITDIVECYSLSDEYMTKLYGFSQSTTTVTDSKFYTDAEMKDITNFGNYDPDVWTIVDGANAPSVRIPGDSKNRGYVTARDVLDVLGTFIGVSDIDNYELPNIDFNGDGSFTLADLGMFMTYLRGKGASNKLGTDNFRIVISAVKKQSGETVTYELTCFDPVAGSFFTDIPADSIYEEGSIIRVIDNDASGSPVFGNVFANGTELFGIDAATANAGYVELASYDEVTYILKTAGSDAEYVLDDNTVVTFAEKSKSTFKVVEADVLASTSKIYFPNEDKTKAKRVVICAEKNSDGENQVVWVMIVTD